MNHLSSEQEASLKTLVAQFVGTYMGDFDTVTLHADDADYIGDTFYGILMDEFVNAEHQ